MAPPHTMKCKTPSPTTLIPGLEAMHITSNQLVKSLADELEEVTKNMTDGDKSDTESVESRESKEYDASAESDGATSFDEGNESMEYISPAKVIGKEEKQDPATPTEGPAGLKSPERASTAGLDTPLQLLPGVELSTAERPIKPLRTKSPRSSSPVQGTPKPPQPKSTDLPFTISDFGFGSTIASPKSSRSSSPAQSIAAALPSSTFEFSFGSAVSSPESSTPSSPFQATPTPIPSTAANKFDFSFGATVATMPLNSNANAAAKIEGSAQLSAPQGSNDDEKKVESAAVIATTSMNLNTTSVDNSVDSPQMSTAQPPNGEKKGESAVAIATTPLNFTTPSADNIMESSQLSTHQTIIDESKSEVTLISNLSKLRPSSISTPPITPQFQTTSYNFNELSKDLPNGAEKKNSTPSTLATLTKTTQALETTIESIHSALYGVNPSSATSQPAKNAGLLLMNDCVAGWINESQLQNATVNNRITTFGNQMELMRQDLKDLKSTTAKAMEQMTGEHTAALNEIKEMMKEQMKEVQELREREQANLATALHQKNDLMEELIKVKEAQKARDEENTALKAENRALKETAVMAQEIRQQEQTSIATLSTLNQNLTHDMLEAMVAKIVSEQENKSLRAENREIKKMMEEESRQCQKLIERLTTKVEFAVTSLIGLHVEKQNESEDEDYGETDEMSDDLMEVLWPQGWGEEGARKRCAVDGQVLQRGVLANEPGARVPTGNVGRGGGGWCTVM